MLIEGGLSRNENLNKSLNYNLINFRDIVLTTVNIMIVSKFYRRDSLMAQLTFDFFFVISMEFIARLMFRRF